MDFNLFGASLLFLFFILLAAFFSSCETVFTSLNKVKAHALHSRRVRGSKALVSLMENRPRLLTAILIGSNISQVAVSTLATTVALSLLLHMGIPNVATALAIITPIVTLILLVFGEITPKFLVLKHPDRWALLYSKPISLLMIIFYPLIESLHWIIWLVGKMFRMPMEDVGGVVLTTDEIKSMATLGQEEGLLEKEEREMIHSIIEFSNTIVREIMTPRTDAMCIDASSSIKDTIALIAAKGHSRIPVYEERIDNIIGIIYAKDLLTVPFESQSNPVKEFARKAVFIPEFKNIEDLFHQMRSAKLHIAIVVDEHGGFSGLVTMEDIIEEIIGDIQDEYDREEMPEFTQVSDHRFIVDAKMNIDDLGEKLGILFPENEDYDTVGGFMLEAIGNMPTKDDKVTYQEFIFTVKEIKEQRILSIEIIKQPNPNE